MGQEVKPGMSISKFQGVLVLNIDEKQRFDPFDPAAKITWDGQGVDVCLEASSEAPYNDRVIGKATLHAEPNLVKQRQIKANIEIFSPYPVQDLAPSVEGVTLEREASVDGLGRILRAEIRRIRLVMKNSDPRIGSLNDQFNLLPAWMKTWQPPQVSPQIATMAVTKKAFREMVYEPMKNGQLTREQAMEMIPAATGLERPYAECLADDLVATVSTQLCEYGLDGMKVVRPAKHALQRAFRTAILEVLQFLDVRHPTYDEVLAKTISDTNAKSILSAFKVPAALIENIGPDHHKALIVQEKMEVPYYQKMLVTHPLDCAQSGCAVPGCGKPRSEQFNVEVSEPGSAASDWQRWASCKDPSHRTYVEAGAQELYRAQMTDKTNISELMKALEAGGFNAAPTELRQGCGPCGGGGSEPCDTGTAKADVCACDIKDLMSPTGHKKGCPEAKKP